ncbi:MAG: hypothetical protein ACRDH9_03915 [Actinomycetota bacterium]
MARKIAAAALLVGVVALASPALATTGKGQLYLNDEMVGTTVNSAPLPNGGTDDFFVVTNGVSGQLGIAGIGPGEPGYTGGDWAVWKVTFTTTPYLLTSDEAVDAAETAGDVMVTRDPGADFRCPITKKS